MTDNGNRDYVDAYREMLATWEKMANDFGSRFLQQKGTAQAMNSLSSAALSMRTQMQDGMVKALDAAQIPSKADIEDIGRRLSAIEAALARIETRLAETGGSRGGAAAGPARTRKPRARG